MTKTALFTLATLLLSTSAFAAEIPVSLEASPALSGALRDAGASPAGPSSVSQTILVSDVKCESGFIEMTHKNESNCSFVNQGSKHTVDGPKAANLTKALIDAGLIKRGVGEMSGGSVAQISCLITNTDGLKTVRCTAVN
jgi:hypothetical protein